MIFWLLVILALIWIIFAVIQDFKTREIANWVSFSLIVFVIALRLFYSLFTKDWGYLIHGIFGLLVFLAIANIFYYSRLFAGGDAKLLIALGPILAFTNNFYDNAIIFLVFIFLLLLVGSVYGLTWSLALAFKHRKKFMESFQTYYNHYKHLVYISLLIAFVFLIIAAIIYETSLALVSVIAFVFSWLFIYARAIEESCMVKSISVNKLRPGDWLVKEVVIGRKKIKPNWEGLSEKEVELIKNNYKGRVKIKEGIPFSLSFLIAFIILTVLWHSYWGFWQFFWF